MLYIQRASSASFVSLAQLKINSHSSSLMPSLLFVFEVNVDYVEGNSRSSTITTSRCRNCAWQSTICMSNTTFVLILTKNLCCDRFRPTNASLFHVLECLLNNARSRSTSTQTKVRVKRFVHVVLHVDVLDQLLLLGDALHTVCALPHQLSFWPCWLSFIRILRWSSNNCQSWIICEIGRIQIRD